MQIAFNGVREFRMLRITVTEHSLEERWTLQGRLHKDSVPELIHTWNARRGSAARRVVNLSEITSIDQSGEEAIAMMLRDGANVIASGIYTRHLIQELKLRRN